MTAEQTHPYSEELRDFRASLRKKLICQRENMTPDVRSAASAAIEGHLYALIAQLQPRSIGFCWPYRGEFDALPLAERCLQEGRRMALPVVIVPGQAMHFRDWHPRTAMGQDRYGIPVPLSGDEYRPDLLLLPFNGVDRQGYRLGYGGGFFDRTLAALQPRPVAVGVGFALGLVDDIRPQAHDQRLDYVVTELGLSQPL